MAYLTLMWELEHTPRMLVFKYSMFPFSTWGLLEEGLLRAVCPLIFWEERVLSKILNFVGKLLKMLSRGSGGMLLNKKLWDCLLCDLRGKITLITVFFISVYSSRAQGWGRSFPWSISWWSDSQGCQEDWGGPGQIQKVGPPKMDCVREIWGHIPRKFWDFTCSEVCSGGSWGSF